MMNGCGTQVLTKSELSPKFMLVFIRQQFSPFLRFYLIRKEHAFFEDYEWRDSINGNWQPTKIAPS